LIYVVKKLIVSKDDLDFVKINKQLVTTNTIVKRAPSSENINRVMEKRNRSFADYNENVKGKVPD
jgi:hypothetical protein